MATRKPLRKIKVGTFSRGFALAKVSVRAGAKAATHAIGNIFVNESEKPERLKELLVSQMGLLSKELGQLKGSLMKVGQVLSIVGEHFLPPEANILLKSLQNQSPPLEWKAIHKAIRAQLTLEQLEQLEIEIHPLASASLGQVHRARHKATGQWLAMKIQYPGVDAAIEGDLKALRSILSLAQLIPNGPQYEELIKEVRFMLHQEVNYSRELELTEFFKLKLAEDPRFIVPQTFPQFSTRRILTTSLEDGVAVDGPEIRSLSVKRRSDIGRAVFELYLREIFELGAVQTDPHFGNYRVRIGSGGAGSDQLILLDFGAVRELSESFLKSYREMVKGVFSRNSEQLIAGALGLGFLKIEDTTALRDQFIELCFLFGEPFYPPETPHVASHLFDKDGCYLWDQSDLPKRVARKGTQLAFAFRLRPPPREIVFLDRKLSGIFTFLSVLKVRFRGHELVQPYI